MFAIAFLVALFAGVGIMRGAIRDPAVQTLAIVLAIVLTIGTLFYWRVEEWSLLDSLYLPLIFSMSFHFLHLLHSRLISNRNNAMWYLLALLC